MPAGCCCGKACQNVNRECCVDFQNRSQNVPRQTSTAVCDDATPQPLARPDATWGPSCLVGASGVKAAILAERLRSEREGPLLTTNQLQRGKLGSTKCKLTSDNGKKMRAQFETRHRLPYLVPARVGSCILHSGRNWRTAFLKQRRAS